MEIFRKSERKSIRQAFPPEKNSQIQAMYKSFAITVFIPRRQFASCAKIESLCCFAKVDDEFFLFFPPHFLRRRQCSKRNIRGKADLHIGTCCVSISTGTVTFYVISSRKIKSTQSLDSLEASLTHQSFKTFGSFSITFHFSSLFKSFRHASLLC